MSLIRLPEGYCFVQMEVVRKGWCLLGSRQSTIYFCDSVELQLIFLGVSRYSFKGWQYLRTLIVVDEIYCASENPFPNILSKLLGRDFKFTIPNPFRWFIALVNMIYSKKKPMNVSDSWKHVTMVTYPNMLLFPTAMRNQIRTTTYLAPACLIFGYGFETWVALMACAIFRSLRPASRRNPLLRCVPLLWPFRNGGRSCGPAVGTWLLQ